MHALEATQSELQVLPNRLSDQGDHLRLERKEKGKRVALQGTFVLQLLKTLKLPVKAEEPKKGKKLRRQPWNRAKGLANEEGKESDLESTSTNSKSDRISIAGSGPL